MVLIAPALAGFIALSVWNSRRMTSKEKADQERVTRRLWVVARVGALLTFVLCAAALASLFYSGAKLSP
jgi:hypothetical protein